MIEEKVLFGDVVLYSPGHPSFYSFSEFLENMGELEKAGNAKLVFFLMQR